LIKESRDLVKPKRLVLLVGSRVGALVLTGIAVWAVLVNPWALFLVGGAQHRRVIFWVAFVAFGLLATVASKAAIQLWRKAGEATPP
jgi:hypothetical protein